MIDEFGCPASTLIDNGMVSPQRREVPGVRQSADGVRGGLNASEHELAALGVVQ